MIYLSGYFIEACQDLPNTAAGTLHRRFLGWPARIPAEHWHADALEHDDRIDTDAYHDARS
ncbi:hypothetical protein QTQ03_15975 [Micromonospora sp. WMMA1363]|uniref:hypothetical protein n=1 Tax=Micromonospora sp. WMMA1363 TaxID=3053985 RepID=UPI00259CDF19|nr:hypothetical protein [Micromonospora sp. WMMA1363]MDM4721019.1 hypothetical protein [Micromonospora sp. WMMA1363]